MQVSTNVIAPAANPFIRLFAEGRFRALRHGLFILVGLILAFLGDMSLPEELLSHPGARQAIFLFDLILFILMMGMLYLVQLVLIPKFLFRPRIYLFVSACFIIIAIVYTSTWLLDYYLLRPVLPVNGFIPHFEMSFGAFIEKGLIIAVLIGCVTGLKVFKKWINDMQRMNAIQQFNLKAELEQLKSQVNPHFLFNTLNNLFVLMKTDPEKASQVLLGLSDLLRYQLYDSAREKILLTKDIAFMHNLLALEKIRKDDFAYEINTEGRAEGVLIPPFLFIPFVENAIKHGASSVGRSYLRLDFNVEEQQLVFRSENSKPPVKPAAIGGLGLKNIHRRLELLYPGRYSLNIQDSADKYIVHLTIPL